MYATGSYGREEANEHSDLDLFIVGLTSEEKNPWNSHRSRLSHLDEICIKADLIEAIRKLSIHDFDGDGKYLTHYAIADLIESLGKPEDDSSNTFTARLLLLLESRPIIGEKVYAGIIKDAIAPYWVDYESHKNSFTPAFFANDILRLWRTFCVNYEARRRGETEAEKISGKLKNYKLKHSRMITCYSALLYILVIYQQRKTVDPDDVLAMVGMTPLERIVWLKTRREIKGAHAAVDDVVSQYNKFLETTSISKTELAAKFADQTTSLALSLESYEFGEKIYGLLQAIGDGSRLHRILTV